MTAIIITVIIILGIAFLIDKIYGKIDMDNYSPIWEYFSKALLYGFMLVLHYSMERNR